MIKLEDFMHLLEKPKKYDKYIQGLCPFHADNSPSLLVFKDGYFRCLGCQRHGTWKTLWNKLHGQEVQVLPEIETSWKSPDLEGRDLYELAYLANKDLIQFPSIGWYLEMRGLTGRIEPSFLGFWKGWYTIPVFDRNREFLNVVFRAAPHVEAASGIRYWYKGAPHLYVPDWKLVLENKYLVVTFGILDALTLAELRIPAATPSNGQDSFRSEWLDDLRRVVYFLPDQDEEQLARKYAKELGWRGNVVYLDWYDGMKDANDFMSRGKQNELLAQLQSRIE